MASLVLGGCDLILLNENKDGPPPPPFEAGVIPDAPPNTCFGDDFNDGSLNATLWQELGGPIATNAVLIETNNALRVKLLSTPCGSCAAKNGVLGRTVFDFTNAGLELRVRPATLTNEFVSTTFLLDVAGVAGTLTMTAKAGQLELRASMDAANDKVIPYTDKILAWRFRHTGNFVFEVFIEGSGWKLQREVISPLSTAATRVQLYAESEMGGGNNAEAIFDEVVLYGPNCVQSVR